MAEDRDRNAKTGDEAEDREARRKDSGADTGVAGAVDGIGGAGGASGTGGVRAKARAVGEISGIGPVDEQDVPAPGSVGKGKSGSRTRQMSDGGLTGKTRGEDSETIPNQESAAQRDAEKTNRSGA